MEKDADDKNDGANIGIRVGATLIRTIIYFVPKGRIHLGLLRAFGREKWKQHKEGKKAEKNRFQ